MQSVVPILKTFFLLLLLAGICLPVGLEGQTSSERDKLEARRKKLQQEIEYTSRLLKKTRKSKRAAMQRYQAILRQVKAREELIATLQEEVAWLESDMRRDSLVNQSLKEDLVHLEEEYGGILRAAFRQKLNNRSWLFILSASGINDMLRRWLLLHQYRRFRQRQAQIIAETRSMLEKRIALLEERRLEKAALLAEEQAQNEELAKELHRRDQLLRSLRQDENRLKRELNKKRADDRRLNNAIAEIIRAAEAERRKKIRERADQATAVEALPAMDAASRGFYNLKGRLPWPVKKGLVTSRFGKQPHPSLPGIFLSNNGIDIRTDAQAKVLAVHQGEVVDLRFIQGSYYMIIVRHGIYYSVYSNLEHLYVTKGDKVSRGQALGSLHTDVQTGTTELHFEIWRSKDRLDPARWLKKK